MLGSDDRERCLWLSMSKIGVCGTGRLREVYVGLHDRERCTWDQKSREVYEGLNVERTVCGIRQQIE
jgi:hypothetical protein